MLLLVEGCLNPPTIFSQWHERYHAENFGAFITFTGIVRDEDHIDGLSFDIYEPILDTWFAQWQEKATQQDAIILMAHSKGDVLLHECSYIAAVLSPKRKIALSLICDFVEDFKANAPIWKYDIRGEKRVYAATRSTPMNGAGILASPKGLN